MPAAQLGEEHRHGRGGHQRQHPGRVGRGLGVDLGLEQHGDDRGDEDEDADQWAGRARPVRGHAVARQVAGDDVEQPRERRGPGEPQDADRGHVIHRPEGVPEPLVRQVGESTPVGLPAGPERGRRDQQGGDEGRPEQRDAHDAGGRGQELLGVADAAARLGAGVARVALDEGHHHHAGLEAGQAERQGRKDEQGCRDDPERRRVARRHRGTPVADQRRVGDDGHEAVDHDDGAERQVDDHEHDGDADGLGEALEEHRTESQQQRQGEEDLVAAEGRVQQGVLDEVGGGVGRGQGDRDDEPGHDEAEQRQHQQLARPVGEELLQHRQGAVAVRALDGDPAVHREGAEEGDDHQHEGGDRRQGAGGQRRDARLVAERGEVVDAGQAHDLPPGVDVVLPESLLLALVEAARVGLLGVEEPAHERAARPRDGHERPG